MWYFLQVLDYFHECWLIIFPLRNFKNPLKDFSLTSISPLGYMTNSYLWHTVNPACIFQVCCKNFHYSKSLHIYFIISPVLCLPDHVTLKLLGTIIEFHTFLCFLYLTFCFPHLSLIVFYLLPGRNYHQIFLFLMSPCFFLEILLHASHLCAKSPLVFG